MHGFSRDLVFISLHYADIVLSMCRLLAGLGWAVG
jgi:hypothetical protein